ncbi:MAG: hypothetical protein ACJ72M_06870 [Propionibacteriaceae bacterium]
MAEEVAAWVAAAVGNAEAAARTSDDLNLLRTTMMSRTIIDEAKGIRTRHSQCSSTLPNVPTQSFATWPQSWFGPTLPLVVDALST